MGVYLVHHPLHNSSPEVGGGRLHGNGRLQGTLQYYCSTFIAVIIIISSSTVVVTTIFIITYMYGSYKQRRVHNMPTLKRYWC